MMSSNCVSSTAGSTDQRSSGAINWAISRHLSEQFWAKTERDGTVWVGAGSRSVGCVVHLRGPRVHPHLRQIWLPLTPTIKACRAWVGFNSPYGLAMAVREGRRVQERIVGSADDGEEHTTGREEEWVWGTRVLPVAREKEVALAPEARAEGDRPTGRQTTSHLPFVRTYSTSTALYLHEVPRFVTRGKTGLTGTGWSSGAVYTGSQPGSLYPPFDDDC